MSIGRQTKDDIHEVVLNAVKFQKGLNPTLPPGIIVSQIPPWNDLRGFGVSRFNLHPLNGIGRQVRRYHPADQKVLLFGQGLHSRPLGQQQFFGI